MLTLNRIRQIRGGGIVALGLAIVVGAGALGQEPSANDDSASRYLRVQEQKGRSISLEIASRDFVPKDGDGPVIGLISVAHIADASFYDEIDRHLTRYDLVLYESVMPPGAGGARGDNDEERINSSKAAMKFLASMIETHHAKKQAYPADLDTLQQFIASLDPRLASFLANARRDAWGREFIYEPAFENNKATDYRLLSFGADGAPGGEGVDADIVLAERPKPVSAAEDDGLQAQLASALGLAYQLDSLAYESTNWRCSDMAMDELSRRLADRGVDFEAFGGTLAGTSFPAQVVRMILGLIKMADAFSDGAVTDTFKVVMIEILGDPTVMDQGLSQLGPGFGEVILNERNQVVMDDLKRVLQDEPQHRSIAILYGAAHMPDFADRLADQFGYQPRPEDQTLWIPAITVDLTTSKVSQANLNMIRRSMKQSLQQQKRPAPRKR